MVDQFPHLFSPIKIGPVTFPNRIVMGAHGTCLRAREEILSQKELDYWVAKLWPPASSLTQFMMEPVLGESYSS